MSPESQGRQWYNGASSTASRDPRKQQKVRNFTEHPEAEATNNRAERALRHAVLWRKTSNGTQTEAGERFVERILSIRETCRLNQQPLHGYLVDVHTARLTGQPTPTPLPAAHQAAA